MMTMELAPYAVSEENSRGREHEIELARDRNAFRRDYTRIIHSQAFRRLQGKTQVFSSMVGDDRFRTRMSHSLEVEQITTALCNRLRLNADLGAAVAIGHDIGHAPFGHLGQDVLNELMADHGGFEHNLQALRLVDQLESPYLEHRGLNLMFETREGLLKHCTTARASTLGAVAARHLTRASPPLEIQVADVADAIAYCHADLEDAFTMNTLSAEELLEVPGYRAAWTSYAADKFGPNHTETHPTSADLARSDPEHVRRSRATVFGVIRLMISHAIDDVTCATRQRLESFRPQSVDDVRKCPVLVGFSAKAREQHLELKSFSLARIYMHPDVVNIRGQEKKILTELFHAYVKDPQAMTGRGPDMNEGIHRAVADYVAGMTDRFAHQQYQRLKEQRPDLFESQPQQRRARTSP